MNIFRHFLLTLLLITTLASCALFDDDHVDLRAAPDRPPVSYTGESRRAGR
jgi:hypothetical protein